MSQRHRRDHPNSEVIRHDALREGSLRGYEAVILVTHGGPNASMWGGDRVGEPGAPDYKEMPGYTTLDGMALAAKLQQAGFEGQKIFLDSCNGGTESKVGALGTSTAQALATATGAQVLAARADDDKVQLALQSGLEGVAGTVTQAGDLDSDVRPDGEELSVTVPDGYWAVFSPPRR